MPLICISLFGIAVTLLFTFAVQFGVKQLLVFPPISSETVDQIKKLTAHVDVNQPVRSLTAEEINAYHRDGFTIVRGAVDGKTIEAMKLSVSHIMNNPSGLLKRANGTNFCGFSLHNHLLLPFWRNFVYRLPLASIAAQLMDTNVVLYSQDIIHATTSHCPSDGVGRTHSDQNQGPFSIEKKKNYGDNMVVAWVAVDPLDYINMELFNKSHRTYGDEHQSWHPQDYCKFWEDYLLTLDGIDGPGVNISMKPGDVAFFQGLTFHRVRKNVHKCYLDTCRRVTIRYIDGEVTRWRDDIPPSKWPIISSVIKPGSPITTLPRVVDNRVDGSIEYGQTSTPGPYLPPVWYWMDFIRNIIFNGLSPNDIINQCDFNMKLNKKIDQEHTASHTG